MTVMAEPDFGPAFRAELLELFRWRRDVRRFRPDPLPEGTLERLFEIANSAPSVGLSQPWRFVVVEGNAPRSAIRANFERSNQAALAAQHPSRAAAYARLKLEGLKEAPCQFATFSDAETLQGHGLGRATMPRTIEYSAVLALSQIWLAARAEGVGLGWVSILDPADVATTLDVPGGWVFVGYFCLGYPLAPDDKPALERANWEQRVAPHVIYR